MMPAELVLYKHTVDYIVARVFDAGRVMPLFVRHASETRGRIDVRQELDNGRSRHVLVARLAPVKGHRAIPPLYDAVLVGAGEVWVLSGVERVVGGPLGHEHWLAQSWLIRPGPIDDLIKAEGEVNRLSGLLHELQAKTETAGK